MANELNYKDESVFIMQSIYDLIDEDYESEKQQVTN